MNDLIEDNQVNKETNELTRQVGSQHENLQFKNSYKAIDHEELV